MAGSWPIRFLTASNRFFSFCSVSIGNSNEPSNSKINCYNYVRIPSSSLQSKTSLTRSSSCCQFCSTSWLILNLAARSTFFTLLWWRWDQQSQETRTRTRMRTARKQIVEVKAQALQSNVPAWMSMRLIYIYIYPSGLESTSLTHQEYCLRVLASPFYSVSLKLLPIPFQFLASAFKHWPFHSLHWIMIPGRYLARFPSHYRAQPASLRDSRGTKQKRERSIWHWTAWLWIGYWLCRPTMVT